MIKNPLRNRLRKIRDDHRAGAYLRCEATLYLLSELIFAADRLIKINRAHQAIMDAISEIDEERAMIPPIRVEPCMN